MLTGASVYGAATGKYGEIHEEAGRPAPRESSAAGETVPTAETTAT